MPYIFIFAGSVTFTTLLMLFLLWKSPVGYQDETGFHYGVQKGPEENDKKEKEVL